MRKAVKIVTIAIIPIILVICAVTVYFIMLKTSRPDYTEEPEAVVAPTVQYTTDEVDMLEDDEQSATEQWSPYIDVVDDSTVLRAWEKYALNEGKYAVTLDENIINTTIEIYSQDTDEILHTMFLSQETKPTIDIVITEPSYIVVTQQCVLDVLQD